MVHLGVQPCSPIPWVKNDWHAVVDRLHEGIPRSNTAYLSLQADADALCACARCIAKVDIANTLHIQG